MGQQSSPKSTIHSRISIRFIHMFRQLPTMDRAHTKYPESGEEGLARITMQGFQRSRGAGAGPAYRVFLVFLFYCSLTDFLGVCVSQPHAKKKWIPTCPYSAEFEKSGRVAKGQCFRLGNISGNFWKFSEIFPKISKGLEKLEILGNLFFLFKSKIGTKEIVHLMI